jgi:NADPH:quinone reductase-like Zn-dependent oxidoreductase
LRIFTVFLDRPGATGDGGDKEMMMAQLVEVEREAFVKTHLVDAAMPELEEGDVLLSVESFAVTANNVTYAAIGEAFGYWNFFPANDGRGIVPMWGHARVVASRHPDFALGERVYGYLPMGTHLVVRPGDVSAGQFLDTTAHRQPMNRFYNMYSRLAADPEHDPAREAARMVFGPLFKTGFLIEAMFRLADWHGAAQMVMTSASSKTAMALASVAKASSPSIRRIGLTSAGNVDFVKATGLYDQVLAYDAVGQLPRVKSVSVDFAGNPKLLSAIHTHFGDDLAYSCLVGVTHIGARGESGGGEMPGPAPILFFAPDYAMRLVKELGPAGFAKAVGARWHGFVAETEGFMSFSDVSGLDAARDAFVAAAAGTADPAKGVVVRP